MTMSYDKFELAPDALADVEVDFSSRLLLSVVSRVVEYMCLKWCTGVRVGYVTIPIDLLRLGLGIYLSL